MKMILARSAGLLDLISAESLFNLFKHRSPSRRKHRGTASLNLGANCVQIERLEEKVVLSASFGSAITVNNGTNPGIHAGEAVTTDVDGNVYITGTFSYSADFDPRIEPNSSAILTDGSNDAFVAKYLANGTFAWVTAFRNDAQNSGGLSGEDIAVVNGNVYVTGEYGGGIPTFGSATTLSAAVSTDGYVTMLDAEFGAVQWAKRIGGLYRDSGRAIAVDATGNAYVTYTLGVIETNVNADWDVRVAKFDIGGIDVWNNHKQVGGSSVDESAGIAVDGAGNVVVTGTFRNSGDFDPGTGIYKLSTASNTTAAFVLKLTTADGSFVWADAFSVAGRFGGGASAFDVAIDSVDNIYVTGSFSGNNVDFDPGKGKLTLPNAGGSDGFVVKLSSAGSLLWGRSMGGTNNDAWNAGGLAVDRAKNVYVTGVFGLGAGNFDTATFGSTTLTSAGDQDIFVTKLDTNGVFKWAVGAGGTGADVAKGISVYTPPRTDPLVGKQTNIYTTGLFSGTVDFNPATNTATDGYFNLTALYRSLFLWKLLDDQFV